MEVLYQRAVELDVRVRVLHMAEMFVVDFANNGGACPFLDQDTNLCRVYADRPDACRAFPTKFEERCVLFRETAG